MPWFIYTLLPGTIISLAAIARFGSIVIISFIVSAILLYSGYSLNLPLLYVPGAIFLNIALGLIIYDIQKENNYRLMNSDFLNIEDLKNKSEYSVGSKAHLLYKIIPLKVNWK